MQQKLAKKNGKTRSLGKRELTDIGNINQGENGNTQVTLLRVDLGCGKNKKEGFLGVDRRKFDGVEIVLDITKFKWPWENDSVDEVHCSHFLEHLHHNQDKPERVKFMNELYRVMKPEAKATIITPHWASCRAYGDFTHADKPVSEFFWYYLSKEWRKVNAPDNDIEWNPDGYSCNFECTWGYSLHPAIVPRNQEYQTHAMQFWKESCQDMICTLVKKVVPNVS